ncbi:hypothetical protein GF337_00475, partial [candidate division KSB1 bacterium]|nr:hypothetical protein [candidate division KSB1 bacterium]
MQKNTWFLIAVLTLVCSSIAFGNGLNLNSIGPKSVGMGGAYVGLANDYSAIFWNPAGLSQLKGPQVGLFFTNVLPTCTYEVPAYGVDAKTKSNIYPSP